MGGYEGGGRLFRGQPRVRRPISCSASHKHPSPGDEPCRMWRRQFLPVLLAPLPLLIVQTAQASKLGPAVDKIWEGVGGGAADLFFPDAFEGTWNVTSSLVNVETPLGPEYVPDIKVVNRAQTELNKATRYSVRFFKTRNNQIITDRRYNTESLLGMYYGSDTSIADTIVWNPDDPNILNLKLPDGTAVFTRVTRRSSNRIPPDRLETSEYFQQVYDSGEYTSPKIRASQCFTKYKWRSEEAAQAAGGPIIVATQVVSDYLTPSSGEQLMMETMGKPVDILTYRMAFERQG